MDGCKGIEPSSSDWKSEIITIIPTPDVEDIYCPPGSAHSVYSAIGVEEPYSYTSLNKCCIVFAIPLFSGCHSIYITVEENNS